MTKTLLMLMLLLGLGCPSIGLSQQLPVVAVVTPASPTANDRISVEVYFGSGAFVGTHSHSVSGNVIEVRVAQDGIDLGPNPFFIFREDLGRLPAGTYQVHISVQQGTLNWTSDQVLVVANLQNPTIDLAIEFFNASLDHYFVTNNVAEINDLDSGAHSGWTRTGQSFKVFRAATLNSVAVCRYYITPAWGDSHFLSASRDECASLNLQNYVETWHGHSGIARYLDESDNAFYLALPASDGSCTPGWVPIFRLWNARADSDHRYTSDSQTKAAMLAQGYVAEGYGPNAVAMCAPP